MESTCIASEEYLIKTENRFPQLSEYGIHDPCSYLLKMLLATPILYIYASDSRNHEYCSHFTARACFLKKNISNIYSYQVAQDYRKVQTTTRKPENARRTSFEYSSHQIISLFHCSRSHILLG
jgi:hypothetical protein